MDKVDKRRYEAEKEVNNTIIGTGAIAAGMSGAGVYSTGGLDTLQGRSARYHNTGSKNVDGIFEKGILGGKATGKDNLTNKVFSDNKWDTNALKNKVYLAHNKNVADNVGEAAQIHGINHGKRTNLKLHIPREMLDKRKTTNPEMFNKTNVSDYRAAKLKNQQDRVMKNGRNLWEKQRLLNDLQRNHLYNRAEDEMAFEILHNKTDVIEGSIPSKYVEGELSKGVFDNISKKNKNFKRFSPQEVKYYVKNHPKEFFKKNAIPMGFGAATLAGAGAVAYGINKNKKLKEKYEKTASETYEFITKI